ncbi:hypothetical protein Psta_3710 [Pirellula staleyi DSM 6068]|uniref:Uncharacterized protein n=1 Tax=Pirellula staleyi (strain ATCC 27377 / DSM 6068 / ICPB 4128) TaxID=530564 RepID=D2R000_PIRSD|nr:hypothetical protein Psta_3710 [Pirellula staleyi DSM 6068]
MKSNNCRCGCHHLEDDAGQFCTAIANYADAIEDGEVAAEDELWLMDESALEKMFPLQRDSACTCGSSLTRDKSHLCKHYLTWTCRYCICYCSECMSPNCQSCCQPKNESGEPICPSCLAKGEANKETDRT